MRRRRRLLLLLLLLLLLRRGGRLDTRPLGLGTETLHSVVLRERVAAQVAGLQVRAQVVAWLTHREHRDRLIWFSRSLCTSNNFHFVDEDFVFNMHNCTKQILSVLN
jgi:hypothetical protein